MSLQDPLILAAGEGEHIAFLNNCASVKVGGDRTDGLLTVIDMLIPRGFGPPLHRHDVEDELFHVTEGSLWVSCAGKEQVLEVGGTVWLPKGLPHQFQAVADGPTRMLQISTPAQFEHFAAALGAPMDAFELPEAVEIDPAEVARVCADYQIEVLGPPPPPLD